METLAPNIPFEGERLAANTIFSPTLSEDTARNRARRFTFAFKDMEEDDTFLQLMQGQENALRESAASLVATRKEKERMDLLIKEESKRGGPVSAEEMRWVLSASEEGIVNPFSVFEQEYAKQFIDYVTSNTKQEEVEEFRGILGEMYREMPEVVNQVADASKDLLATTTFARTLAENWKEEVSKQSMGGFAIDMAKFMIPFYYDYKMRNHVKDMGYEPFWTGNNLEAQADKILRMKPEEGMLELERITNDLGKDNPTLAMLFAMTVAGRASSDVWLDNFFQGLDIAGIGLTLKPLAKGAIAGAKAAKTAKTGAKLSERGQQITEVFKQGIKASAGPDTPDQAKMLAASGNVEDSAITSVAKTLMERGTEITNATNESHIKSLLSVFRTDIDNLRQGAGSMAREAHVRLLNDAERDITKIEELINNIRNVDRLTPEALQAALKSLQKASAETYRFADDHFIDIAIDPFSYDQAANVYNIELRLGSGNGGLFDFQEEASLWAQAQGIDLKDSSVQIKQFGNKWYIGINKPVRETDDLVREALIPLKNETPVSTLNSWIGFLRSSEDTLSEFQRNNRHIASYAPQSFFQLMYDMAKDIQGVKKGFGGRKRARNLESILKLGRTEVDPTTGLQGYWYRTVEEVETAYQKAGFGLPSEQEVKAYFAYVRLNEFDRVLRNLAVYRNKHRLGTEQTQIQYLDEAGKVTSTEWFDAIPMKEIPWGAEANVLIINPNGKSSLRPLDEFTKNSRTRKQLDADFKDGRIKVVKVYDVDSKPLEQFAGSERVNYVITYNSFKHKPLDFEQVPRRGGGHIEYDYNYYIKQGRIRSSKVGSKSRALYEGDTTIMAIGTNAQGAEISKHINKTLEFIRNKDEKGARAYLTANTQIPWKDFKKWDLNANEPVMVVPREKSTIDMDPTMAERYAGRGFRDASRDPHNPARMYGVQFTQERDSELYTIANRGSWRNPLFNYEPARVIDPLPMLNRAMGKIVHSRFLDDYKIQAIESWAQEAIKAGALKDTGRDVNRNPYFHFFNPDYRDGFKGTDRHSALETMRFQTQMLLGQRTDLDMKLHSLNQKIVDSIYKGVGPQAAELTQAWLLPAQADPWKYLRAMAFHSKLGLFNWSQILVQAQTFTHILGVAGPNMAMRGASGSYFSRVAWMRNADQALIKNLDDKASKFGWKPGEFAESHNELVKSGFMHVMGEQAFIDDALSPNLIKGSFGTFLDWGTVFFKEGERQIRMAAWHTAFKEFRRANPTGRITNTMHKEILNRADLLYGNMSRASQSQVHRGIFSVPSQFLTYQLRIMEQFLGGRLSNLEKARAFTTYGLMYGFPVAIGVTGAPVASEIRQAFLDRGVDLSEGFLSHTLGLGLPSLIISLITGQTTNYGDRFGIQGFTTLREALWSDREWWELALGASGSVLTDTWRESQPLLWAMGSLFKDGGETYPLQSEDLVNAARAISVVNNGWRGLMAYNLGIWESRKGRNLTNVTQSEAIGLTVFGLHPHSITDMHDKSMSLKTTKEMQKSASDMIVRELQRGFQAANNKDYKTSEDYFKRASALFQAAGMQPWQQSEVLSRAFRGYESMVETIDWSFIKNAPLGQYQQRLDALAKKSPN